MRRLLLALTTLLVFWLPNQAFGRVLWSKAVDGLVFSLHEESPDYFHFAVREERDDLNKTSALGSRKISLKNEEHIVTLSFSSMPPGAVRAFSLPSNPLVQSFQIRSGAVEVLLTDKGWEAKRIQEGSSSLIISARIHQEHFEINAYVSKGANPPTMRVWDAKVKSRKVIPVPLIPLSDEELGELEKVEKEEVKPAEGEDSKETLQENEAPSELLAEQANEDEELAQDQAVEVGARDSTELSLAEEALLLSKGDASEEAEKEVSPLAALDKEFVPVTVDSVESDVSLIPREVVAIIDEPMTVKLSNLGLSKISVTFSSKEEKGRKAVQLVSSKEVRFAPEAVELLPMEDATIALHLSDKTLKEERIFQVIATDASNAERVVATSRVFIQPKDGIAKVAWNRTDEGITFLNSGNISSKFVDISVCAPQCKNSKDLYLYPGVESFLSVPPHAEIRLTQVVGSNKREGVIPRLEP